MRRGVWLAALLGMLLGACSQSPLGRPTPLSSGEPLILFRNGEHLWRAASDGSRAAPLALPHKHVSVMARAPDQRRFAFGTVAEERSRLIVAAPGENPIGIDTGLPEGTLLMELAWSPNGRYLAYATDVPDLGKGGVYVTDVVTGRSQQVPAPGARALDFAWSPDSRRLALVVVTRSRLEHFADMIDEHYDAAIDVFDIHTGRCCRVMAPAKWVHNVDWSPDCRWLVSTRSRIAEMVDPCSRHTRVLYRTQGYAEIQPPLWSPDGQRILLHVLESKPDSPDDMRSRMVVLSWPRLERLATWYTEEAVEDVAWGPESRRIAYKDWEHLYLTSWDGRGLRILREDVGLGPLVWVR